MTTAQVEAIRRATVIRPRVVSPAATVKLQESLRRLGADERIVASVAPAAPRAEHRAPLGRNGAPAEGGADAPNLHPVARPMTFRAYLDLPEETRAEYVDGCALVNPPPTLAHQRICRRLLSSCSRRSPARPRSWPAPAGWFATAS